MGLNVFGWRCSNPDELIGSPPLSHEHRTNFNSLKREFAISLSPCPFEAHVTTVSVRRSFAWGRTTRLEGPIFLLSSAMEANHESSSCFGRVPAGERGGGEIVEIRIKTLDSRSYTLRVEKNISVPALKEQLASIVGVPVENQRLICRGKVLKDDQLLSAYNVEDGHTLHLVARQPPSTPGVGSSTRSSEDVQGEMAMPPPGGRPSHVSHSLVMGTINFPDNGEGQLPDLNRILNAVISSMGMHVGGSSQGGTGSADHMNSGVLPAPSGVDNEAADGRNNGSDQGTGVRELELQIDALYGLPPYTAGNTGESSIRGLQVVPDALTTMSHYLDRLEQSLAGEESSRTSCESGPTDVRPSTDSPTTGGEARRGASPTALGALVNRVHTSLRGPAGSALSRLASRLESEPTMLDAAARDELQHEAYHAGHLMQHIGALLLELGRATLSLRMGQCPSESVVNSGPAIFISPSGPNPMMVQSSTRQALPRPSAGAVAVETALPSAPAGLTVRQILERADSRQHVGSALNDASGSNRLYPPSTDVADGSNSSLGNVTSGPTGMQGAFVTVNDNGAVRVVPVRSRGAVHLPLGHVHVPAGHVHVDPLFSRFQRQFNFRTASNPSIDTPAANPLPSASSGSFRHIDQAGEGGGGEASQIVNSLSPLLQHITGALQQSGAPTPQRQSNSEFQRPPSTDIMERLAEAEVGPIYDAQATRISRNRETGVAAFDSGLTSMVSDGVTRTYEAGGSEVSSGGNLDAPFTAPIGLGLGGLQPLSTRVRRRRQTQQSSLDEQQQVISRDLAGNFDQRLSMPSIDQFVRAIGGGNGQGGPNIIGQLMRSPVVENLVQQVMQGVGDVSGDGDSRLGPAPSGIDLSGMLHHVVPVVTQMLNGGSAAVFPGSTAGTSARTSIDGTARRTASWEPEAENWQDALTEEEVAGWSETIVIDEERQHSLPPQRPSSDLYRRGTPAPKRQKTGVESAAEKLEDGGSAEVVLRDLADAARTGNSASNGSTSMLDSPQQVVRVDGLAEAYLVVLFNDLAAHVAADPDFGDGSRFPNAARVFQSSSTSTQEDGK